MNTSGQRIRGDGGTVPGGREVSEEPMERGGAGGGRGPAAIHHQLSLMREGSSFKPLPTILSLTFSHNWTLMETIIRSCWEIEGEELLNF